MTEPTSSRRRGGVWWWILALLVVLAVLWLFWAWGWGAREPLEPAGEPAVAPEVESLEPQTGALPPAALPPVLGSPTAPAA